MSPPGARLFVGALCLLLAACGPSTKLSAEEEHERQDAELARSVANDLGSDPQNPFRDAQTLAEDSIGAAMGSNLDQTWIRKMVEHQEGASRLADIVLQARPSTPFRQAAEATKRNSQTRLAQLALLRRRSLRTDTASSDAFGGAVSDMFAAMTLVQGAPVERTWAGKMAAYDRGAVTLAGIEATRGRDERVKRLAREIASVLANEADAFDRLARTQGRAGGPPARWTAASSRRPRSSQFSHEGCARPDLPRPAAGASQCSRRTSAMPSPTVRTGSGAFLVLR